VRSAKRQASVRRRTLTVNEAWPRRRAVTAVSAAALGAANCAGQRSGAPPTACSYSDPSAPPRHTGHTSRTGSDGGSMPIEPAQDLTDDAGVCSAVVDAVVRPRRAQVRVPAPVFDSAQQQCGAIDQARRTPVEHRMCRRRPVGRGQDRVLRMAVKTASRTALTTSRRDLQGARRRRSARRWHAPPHLAERQQKGQSRLRPWLRFGRSTCNPSRQPPVDGS